MASSTRELDALTEKIIGCAYAVSNGLGAGFLEKVYENALCAELRAAGLDVRQQHPLPVHWRGEVVGDYYADVFVEASIVVELKSTKAIGDAHVAQCLNYLRASGLPLCLLLNFGKGGVEVRRVIHTP